MPWVPLLLPEATNGLKLAAVKAPPGLARIFRLSGALVFPGFVVLPLLPPQAASTIASTVIRENKTILVLPLFPRGESETELRVIRNLLQKIMRSIVDPQRKRVIARSID